TITNSAEPVCRADWLAEGTHVNVAGANSYDRREVDAETGLRAAVKATDHVEQAKGGAGRLCGVRAAPQAPWAGGPGAGGVFERQSYRPDIAVRPDAVQVARHCARGRGLCRARLSARARRRRWAADPDLSRRRCPRSQERRSPAIGVALARNRLPQNFPRGLR